jgi:hypothetical protein
VADKIKYRGYFFVHKCLSGIAQGIQAVHAGNEVLCKYKPTSKEYKLYIEWVKHHKTVIFLDGGFSGDIEETYLKLTHYGKKLHLPCALFREDGRTLGEAVTASCIVVPENIYDKYRFVDEGLTERQEDLHDQLGELLRSYRLA